MPQQMCKLETTQKNLQIQEIQKTPQRILKQKTLPQILRRRFYFIKTLQAKSRKSNKSMFGAPAEIIINSMIISHLATAILSLIIGSVVLLLIKGTKTHKAFGKIWIGLMLYTAISSFWIGDKFSWIHGISIWVIIGICIALYAIRYMKRPKAIRIHAGFMVGNYIGLWSAAIPAALTEGRLTHQILFG